MSTLPSVAAAIADAMLMLLLLLHRLMLLLHRLMLLLLRCNWHSGQFSWANRDVDLTLGDGHANDLL